MKTTSGSFWEWFFGSPGKSRLDRPPPGNPGSPSDRRPIPKPKPKRPAHVRDRGASSNIE